MSRKWKSREVKEPVQRYTAGEGGSWDLEADVCDSKVYAIHSAAL